MMHAEAAAAPLPRSFFRKSLARNRRWALAASYVFLILFAVFFLIPPYYMLVTATKTSEQISNQSTNPWFPALPPTAENIVTLWQNTDFPTYFLANLFTYLFAFPTRGIHPAVVVQLRLAPRFVTLAFYIRLRQHLQFLHGTDDRRLLQRCR